MQAVFDIMVMGVRCNRVMAKALKNDLKLQSQFSQHDLDSILEHDDIMRSSTKLGNESGEDGKESIAKLYNSMLEMSTKCREKLTTSLFKVLAGDAEFIKETQTWRRLLPLPKLGEFKLYFVSTCLRHRHPKIQVRSVVDPNRNHIMKKVLSMHYLMSSLIKV
jgi:hypothetical protein